MSRVETVEIYPGEVRTQVQSGDIVSVFAEQDLEFLAGFGLDGFMTDPQTAPDLVGSLTDDKAFKGISHNGSPRVYTLESGDGRSCVVKPFPDYGDRSVGFNHMGSQELLHSAFQGNPRYAAARVFGHISMSLEDGEGYSLVEYIEAKTLGQADRDDSYIEDLLFGGITKGVQRKHLEHVVMLPVGTSLSDYYDLRDTIDSANRAALLAKGIKIPRLRENGYTNWDFNSGNLLCVSNEDGAAKLVIIDQSAELTGISS